jgi:hypothetical protein
MSDLLELELELCDEVRATLTREIGGMDERIACRQSSKKILAGYLRKGTKRSADSIGGRNSISFDPPNVLGNAKPMSVLGGRAKDIWSAECFSV